ncbi:MAG: HNH endonuclease signature motif containing protein [Singulisphaera sp.]
MSIQEADIKRLWGKAAGRCSHPQCGTDCLPFLTVERPTVVGEMAHVIAKSTGGPRGSDTAGSDAYANLILLCPTHHTLVDKAPPGMFTEQMLLQWKATHEARVEESLRAPVFADWASLISFVRPLLIANHACWKTYGPESKEARSNPNSTAALIWKFRKLSLIVPNNRKIVSAVRANSALFVSNSYAAACDFVEHAEGFERNCITPTEGVPRYPAAFGELFQ